MFEEIPRPARGLSRLRARRVVLGPFVLGGGLALAAIGGSVAVAATVITASTVGLPDLGPHHPSHPFVAAVGTTAPKPAPHAARSATAGPSAATTPTPSSPVTVVASPEPTRNRTTAPPRRPATVSPSRTAVAPTSPRPTSTAPQPSGPVGNAVVQFVGWDPGSSQLIYTYAQVQHGAGAGGSDVYSVTDQTRYRALLAPDAPIVSGTTLCPPAGSRCTPAQLESAAGQGVYAEVAIDASGVLRSVIERDNAPAGSSAPSTQPTPSPTPSATSSAPVHFAPIAPTTTPTTPTPTTPAPTRLAPTTASGASAGPVS